jgi:hypothetical protein
MAKWPRSTALVLDNDGLVSSHPVWLHGVIITATVAGDEFNAYEGQDATSGRQIVHMHGPVNTTFQACFDPPIWCERGLFVTLADGVDHCVVHYTPQPLNPRPED